MIFFLLYFQDEQNIIISLRVTDVCSFYRIYKHRYKLRFVCHLREPEDWNSGHIREMRTEQH